MTGIEGVTSRPVRKIVLAEFGENWMFADAILRRPRTAHRVSSIVE